MNEDTINNIKVIFGVFRKHVAENREQLIEALRTEEVVMEFITKHNKIEQAEDAEDK